MKEEAIEKLAAILWEIIGQIDESNPGLPLGWKNMMQGQLNHLEELMAAEKKTK